MLKLKREGDTVIPIDPFLINEIFLAAVVSCAEKMEKALHDSRRGRKPKVIEDSDQIKEIRKIVGMIKEKIQKDRRNLVEANESPASKSPEQ